MKFWAKNKSVPLLPFNRIKTIIKSSPDIEKLNNISEDSLFTISKATELFIEYLATSCHKNALYINDISYKNLANIVNSNESLEFLQDIIPHKMLVKDCLPNIHNDNE
ncbi:unnamed protein product [Gordionus sp. m RMFG-2023]